MFGRIHSDWLFPPISQHLPTTKRRARGLAIIEVLEEGRGRTHMLAARPVGATNWGLTLSGSARAVPMSLPRQAVGAMVGG